MRVVLQAQGLPGRTWAEHTNVHVALQVGKDPHKPVPGDAESAMWETEVEVIAGEGSPDFRGPAVHGRPGERFLYLTWGDLDESTFTMFRRAKLMLADLGPGVVAASEAVGKLALADARGAPVCARVHDISWALS